MNSYEKNSPVCDAEPRQRETLSELMDFAKNIGNENLIMAKIISRHFFGDANEDAVPKRDVSSYMGAMEEHCDTLKELAGTLHDLIEKLGCPK